MDARLILDEPAGGSWNMAADEVLLAASEPERPVLRLYRWSMPTLSLGYFQTWRSRADHEPSRDLPMVRRSTGGGAIVHDRELTYSLLVPEKDSSPAAARDLMVAVHQSLIELFAELGIAASAAPETVAAADVREPFLCFQRLTAGDIVLQGCKVVGSAQRRQRGRLLQHGSILLGRSPHAPELPGIEDLSGRADVGAFVAERWPERIGVVFDVQWSISSLTDDELGAAKRIEREKFNASAWNLKR